MNRLRLGPVSSLAASSSIGKLRQSPALRLKVNPLFKLQHKPSLILPGPRSNDTLILMLCRERFLVYPQATALLSKDLCPFLSSVSPQNQKMSYAAAALQTGGSSQPAAQGSSSSSASPQVLKSSQQRPVSFLRSRCFGLF